VITCTLPPCLTSLPWSLGQTRAPAAVSEELANNIDDRLRSACQLLSATIAIAMLKNNQADASIKVGSKGTTNISKRSPA
jgi:hypothetical protein